MRGTFNIMPLGKCQIITIMLKQVKSIRLLNKELTNLTDLSEIGVPVWWVQLSEGSYKLFIFYSIEIN